MRTIGVIAGFGIGATAKYADEVADLGDDVLGSVYKNSLDDVSDFKGFNLDENSVFFKNADEMTESGSRNIREELLNSVSNIKLRNCINEVYRQGATVGNGGLSDAIRHELITGELVGGKSHITKGVERVRNLENIIVKQDLDSNDLKIATELLNDLKSALELGGY